MRGIKQALTERYYSWRDAEEVARNDPEVNLSGEGPAYMPVDFEEEDDLKGISPETRAALNLSEPESKPEGKSQPNA